MTPASDRWAVVVMAAGQGKRMRSSTPKVLHELAGRPMVRHVVEAAKEAGLLDVIVVVGPGQDAVREAAGGGVPYAEQPQPLGTGDAVSRARQAAGAVQHLLVLNGDVPLITARTLRSLVEQHAAYGADVTFLTAIVADAGQYGCVQRDSAGRVIDVVEASDRDDATEGPAEINSGQYCFRASWLWPHLDQIPRSASGEYYLTALIEMAVRESATLQAIVATDPIEAGGINDRAQLAQAEAHLRQRINHGHMLAGVTMVDPSRTYIDVDVSIGTDCVIEPNTYLRGRTSIGERTRIGPNATIRDTTVGDRCWIDAATIEEATIEDGVEIGPYCHLRPGAYLCEGVHLGNYAEVKAARLGRGAKMGHFSYIGDANVGDGANIGAGTITCNFDGERKHRTVIGKGAFIGSDTMLVAPVTIGDGARTGAGSVVNKDVPPGAIAVGAPARIMRGDRGEKS
jgi:bifunctional UDP-N-acetylglucosamine pyrophosphorylase/glucosamine-1-phosphate N-acetyltransferase